MSNELIKRGHRVRGIQQLEPIYSEWKDTIKEFNVLDGSDDVEEADAERMVYEYKNFIEKEGKSDVVLATHVPVMTYACYKALLLFNLVNTIPIISWVHGSLLCYRGDSKKLLSFSDAYFAISSQIKAELEKLNQNKPIYLVNNSVNFDGKLIERDKEKLNVYGDGEDRGWLHFMAKDLLIDKNISWHGWISNVWEAVDKADLLVLPSKYEGFPLVVLEALSKGIPVAATKTSGVLSCIEEGVNGWLFDIGDYDQLGEILNRIQRDKSILPLREVCIKSVEKYSVKNITDNFENCILKEFNKKMDFIKIKGIINDIENVSVLNKIAIINYNLAILLYNAKEYEMALDYLKGIKNKDIEVLELENLINEDIK